MSDNESCPVCHVPCKHMWTGDEIFQYRELTSDTTNTQREADDAASDAARDTEKKIDAKRKAEDDRCQCVSTSKQRNANCL